MTPSPRAPWFVRILLAAALVGLAALAAQQVVTPAAKGTNVPADEVSGQRALHDLRVVAARPHPIGSSAQRRVRDYLVAEGQSLGLRTRVQPVTVGDHTPENVIVRLPGTAHTGRDVLLTAHYDSATRTPGASDDGIPVAAMLETMRTLARGPRLRNDLVFLFTDGEELAGRRGGLGMQGFIDRDPTAMRIAVAFAFECLPESSGVVLRTTTPGDGWVVGELRKTGLPVFADSAMNTSDRSRAGNDFAAFPLAEVPAAEFISYGDRVRYHKPGDNVAAVDPGVVQDFADTVVALGRHFGNADLRAATNAQRDRVFLTVPWLGLVDYPVLLAQVLTVVVAAGLVAAFVVARRRRGLRWSRMAVAAFAWLAACAVAAVVALLVWKALLSGHPESRYTLNNPDFTSASTAVAVIVAVAVAAYVASGALLARWLGPWEVAAGALVWGVLLAVLLAFGEPLFSAVTLWVALPGVAGLGVTAWLGAQHPATWVVLLLSFVPAAVVIVPLMLLEMYDVESGPLVAVLSLGVAVGSLLTALLVVLGLPGTRRAPEAPEEVGEGVAPPRLKALT